MDLHFVMTVDLVISFCLSVIIDLREWLHVIYSI